MKKVILTLAFVATLSFVSCKEATEDKVEEATEAVGTEMENKAEEVMDAADSTTSEVTKEVEEGAEKMGEKVEETVK